MKYILNILTFGQYLYKRYRYIHEKLNPTIEKAMIQAEHLKGEEALKECLSIIKANTPANIYNKSKSIINKQIEHLIDLSNKIN